MKIIIAFQIERLHRYVYDNIFIQRHKTTTIQKLVLYFYLIILKLVPDFKQTVKKFASGKCKDFDRYYLPN